MKRVIITCTTIKIYLKRYGKHLRCVHCGRELKPDEHGFKTASHRYYCQLCGENAEIDVKM